MSDSCPYCLQPLPSGPERWSPKERAARRLQRITGGSLPFCRKAVVALSELGWNVEKIEAAIHRFAVPGQAPWEFSKEAASRPFRAEPEPTPLPALSWEEMAKAAGMSLEDWKQFHSIGERE